jgi:nocardicin N-oxygenase
MPNRSRDPESGHLLDAVEFPMPTDRVFEPPAALSGAPDRRQVLRVQLPTGDHAWLVLGFDAVRSVLTDRRFSRAAACLPDAPRMRPMPPDASTILAMDPPEHTRLHRLVVRAFSSRRVIALRPYLTEVADGLVDELARTGPPADLVSGLALPLPMAVICELLGVPYADRDRFGGWTDTMLSLSARDAAEIRAARTELNEYLAGLVAAKRAEPGDDLISDLVQARDEQGALGDVEVAVFAATLLIAGYHTTASALTNTVVTLLRNPARLAELVASPELIPAAVQESLRYSAAPVAGGNLRVALEDVELEGVLIRAGEGVLPSTVGANRDPSVFAEPDRFDPTRRQANLSFGAGVHYCIGAQLAKAELEVALAALVTRFPGLRPAYEETDLELTGSVIRNLTRLPVRW